MDKRIIKTKRDIKAAFANLRSETNLDKIKVNHLCELALVNKSTFYKYYEHIYALSDEVENDIVDAIISDFDCIDSLFDDPQGFIDGMMRTVRMHKKNIRIFFSGKVSDLVDKIEVRLKRHYFSKANTPQKDIMISFLIGGATHVMLKNQCDEKIVTSTLIDLLSK